MMLNKIVLHTVDLYLRTALEQNEETYQRDKIQHLLTKISGYSVFHKFSPEEYKRLKEIGEREAMKDIRTNEVDFNVYGLYLMNIWINEVPKKDRPSLNISDQKIKDLEASLIKDKLEFRFKDKEGYERISKIVEQSKMTAKRYFHYMDNELGRVA